MNERDSLPSGWMIIARKDWNRIYRMLDYDDVEASGEAKKFIITMFPLEKL